MIELNDIDVQEKYVLIGIKINKRNDEKGSLHLIALFKSFDFLTGKLLETEIVQESEKPTG